MALPGGVNALLDELLPLYDIGGSRGCRLFPVTTSILVQVKGTQPVDGKSILLVDQFMPDGFGISCFWDDAKDIPHQNKLNEDLTVLWDSSDDMPCSQQLVWLRQVQDLGSWPQDFVYDQQSYWMNAEIHRMDDAHGKILHHVEFFSGGFGGWSMANRLIGEFSDLKIQTIGLDSDPQIAKAFALTHNAAFHQPTDMMPRNLLSKFDGNWSLCTDICQPMWMPAIAEWGTHFLTISSPCQPWSGAASAPGLADPNGQLLLRAVLQARYLRPTFIGFENVPGFARHCHKSVLLRVLRYCGFRMLWEQIIDVQSKLGISRPRWIALAARVEHDFTPSPFKLWTPHVVPPNHDGCVIAWDANMVDLCVTPANYQMANDPAFFRAHGKDTKVPLIIHLRTYDTTQVLPTFMARYGTQHQLPEDHLRKFGLLSHFKAETLDWPFAIRHWHPAEIALLHGAVHQMFIPDDLPLAWLIVGNAITTIHAALVSLQVTNSLFGLDCTPDQLLAHFHEIRLHSSSLRISHTQHGMMLTGPGSALPQELVHSISDLVQMNDSSCVWTPTNGIITIADLINQGTQELHLGQTFSPQTQIPMTIEVDSSPEMDEIEATCPIMKILPAVLQGPHTTMKFHVAADLAKPCVEQYWFFLTSMEFSNDDNGEELVVLTNQPSGIPAIPTSGESIAILIDEQLTIMPAESKVPLASHQFMTTLPADLFDLFGPVNDCQTPAQSTLILASRLPHGSLVHDIQQVFEAFGRTTSKFEWLSDTDSVLVTISGQDTAVSLVLQFWQNALDTQALQTLGRRIEISGGSEEAMIHFLPARDSGVCPPTSFQLAISVAAFRVLLDSPTLAGDDSGVCTQIEWMSRILWEGMLPRSLNTAVLYQLLRHALAPTYAMTPVRLIHKGKQVPYDLALADISTLRIDELNKFHIVLALTGGAPAKLQQRVLQQSALAAVLLEYGCDLKWITTTTEQLLTKYSITKLQSVTSAAPGSARTQAVLNLVKDAGIQLQEPSKPASQKIPQGAPWQPKRNRKTDTALNPMEFHIMPQFFTNQDGSEVIQLDNFRPQATGIALMLPDHAVPFLQGDVLSSDELGIIVFGALPQSVTMTCKSIRFPAFNLDKQMVLLSGHLFQLGAREIVIKEGDPDQIKPEECTLVALTLFRSDWSQDDWLQLVSKPIPFLRSIFSKSGFDQAVLSIWGKSLRHGRAPCSPQQAESMQLHSSLLTSKLHKFLAKSGFNCIYTTPKTPEGKLDQVYKIIWIKDDSASMSVLSMKAPNCLGLVKGRNSLGLRFHQDDHAKAWEVLCPGQPIPTMPAGDLLYKVEGLPFGTTTEMVSKWGEKLQWDVVPIRALGPQSWLLRCSQHPPPGLIMFNSSVVLLRHLPPKSTTNEPLVLGPRATKTLALPAPQRLAEDPWANWKGPRPEVTMTKPAEGPTEARLSAQDEKISMLQKTLEKVSTAQEEQAVATTRRFEEMEQREVSNMKTVTSTIDALRTDIDSSLKQVMQQSTQLMDSRLTELKNMLRQSSKRPSETDQRMEDWLGPASLCLKLAGTVPFLIFLGLLYSSIATFMRQFCIFIFVIAILSAACIRARPGFVKPTSSKQVPRYGLSIAFWNGWISIWIVAVFAIFQPVGASLSLRNFDPCLQMNFCHLLATRVGEASHPGPLHPEPTSQFCNIAITNPTSIVSKFEIYQQLSRDFSLDIICAAETAATPLGQKLFGSQMRGIGMKSIWSQPVGEKVSRTDGQQSLRGNAAGVVLFSKWPARSVVDSLTPQAYATARLLHAVITVGGVQIQMVCLYGLAAAGTSQQTNGLFQEALRVVQLLPLPFIILGDFNCNPWNLEVKDQLSALGVVDLPMVYSNLRSHPMPPTCKNATRPDNALISMHLRPYLVDVSVLPTPWFDAHQVVLLSLDLEAFHQARFRMSMPAPWSDLEIDFGHAANGYDWVTHNRGKPTSIEEWGMAVEEAIEFAFRKTQQDNQGIPWSATHKMPRKYKGRCQPRQPKQTKPALVTMPSRKGDFNPGELCRQQTRAKVRQVRRIHSLLGRLSKTQNCILEPLEFKQLWDEWQAILRSPCMGRCFVGWCQEVPELGPPPMNLPPVEFLSLLGQFVKHDATASAAVDRKLLEDMKQFHQYQDARWCGHAKTYMHLKDNFVAPFDAIATHEQRDVHVTHNDDNTFQVWCSNPEAFQSHQLLTLDEQPCAMISRDSWSIQVKPTQPGDLTAATRLDQKLEIQEPGEIFSKLQAYWQPFWGRSDLDQPGHEQFETFLAHIPDHWVPPKVDMNDLNLWLQAIKELKTPSARGVDAISSWELQQLPTQAIADMKDVLIGYTNGFPSWFLCALTAPVPKTPDTPEVHQIRPITILSQLYRVWSKVLCRQLLDHLSACMPPQLTGLLANRGPLDASMRQQFFVETCHNLGIEASGLSLDLIKCYNTISRPRVHQLLVRLGFPEPELTQWYASLQALTRVWTYQGWCSTISDTSCGIPEGDTFSVVCMLVIDYLWILAVQEGSEDPFLSAYADNIGWATTTANDHHHIIPTTVCFTECFGMSIDWAKTWVWGTSAPAAKLLQQTLLQHVPRAVVAIKRAAMDLGAQLTYAGPPILGQFRKRIDRAVLRLKRLKGMKIPLKSKVLMLQGGIYPVAFYGIALFPLGIHHFDTLRPLCADGLLGPSPSRNSAIAVAATPGACDPLPYAIRIALRTVRRFLNQLTAEEQQTFYVIAARHTGQANQVQGPAGALRYWLNKLGWSISREGLIDVQTFSQVPLRTTSNATMTRWIAKEWQKEVFQFHCRRSAISNLFFDLEATSRLIRTFPVKQQAALLNELSGAYQTERQKQHWATDSDGNCTHCSTPDTRFHRLYECAATADIRLPYQQTLQALQDDGSLLHEMPAIHLDQEAELLSAIHARHIEAFVTPSIANNVQTLITQGVVPCFYTDGSLQYPTDATARHAAYAIVLDLCTSDSQREEAVRNWTITGVRPNCFATIAVARTTGEQRIHRSELFAILRICEMFSASVTYSDSTSAIAVFHKCQQAARPGKLQALEDFDLVERLWIALRRGNHAIHKVKAHVTHSHRMNFLASFHCWGNEVAHAAAVDTCTHMYPDVVHLANQLYIANQLQRDRLTQVFKLHLELHHARALLDSQKETKLPHEEMRSTAGPPQAHVLATWTIDNPRATPIIRLSNLSMCAWGEVLSKLLLEWMSQFRWPQEEAKGLEDPGITFLEMFVSFQLTTGLLPPVKRSRGSKGEFLQPLEHVEDAELYNVPFSEMGTTMAYWIAQARKLLQPDIWPPFSHGPCRSLYRLGASVQSRGITTRPMFPAQAEVVDLLARYIRTHAEFDELPPFVVKALPPTALPQLRHPWDQLRRISSRGATLTKAASGAQQLRFR